MNGIILGRIDSIPFSNLNQSSSHEKYILDKKYTSIAASPWWSRQGLYLMGYN